MTADISHYLSLFATETTVRLLYFLLRVYSWLSADLAVYPHFQSSDPCR